MTKAFEAVLSKINSQASHLEGLGERAVEIGVVQPLLKELGWDTSKLSEVYPQPSLPGGKIPDYDLRIGGKTQILIEVKRWNHVLGEAEEDQLKGYCLKGKPSLSVLTNGDEWRFYVKPWPRGKNAHMRQFLELHISNGEKDIESNFKRFLARNSMINGQAVKQTVEAAAALFDEHQNHGAIMEGLTEAWNNLAGDDVMMEFVVSKLAERYDIQARAAQLKQFVHSRKPTVNKIEVRKPISFPKPASINFSLKGNDPVVRTFEGQQGWNELLIVVCEVLHNHHKEIFGKSILDMPQWFSLSHDGFKHSNPIGDTGVYAKYGGKKDIEERIPIILTKFGYSKTSLTIKER